MPGKQPPASPERAKRTRSIFPRRLREARNLVGKGRCKG
jgi:hypothetical protein